MSTGVPTDDGRGRARRAGAPAWARWTHPRSVLALPFDLLRHDLLMDLAPPRPERLVAIVDKVLLPLVQANSRENGPGPAGREPPPELPQEPTRGNPPGTARRPGELVEVFRAAAATTTTGPPAA